MALAERLKNEAPARTVKFAEWLISLSAEDRAAFESACHPQSGYTNVQLLRIMVDEGGPSSKDSLVAYRRSLT